ncbi:Heterogeneous nuclear ribonucleoprotein Q [Bienertia sinuspersici]
MLEGRRIGVLPSTQQNSLYLGNLPKEWSPHEFDRVVRQAFPDVHSVDLVMLSSDGVTPFTQKQQNRGFGFVQFSSHAAAERAYTLSSRSDFVVGGKCHPNVQWAKEEPEVDPEELAKVKIAFIRNLPSDVNEGFLMKLFGPYGEIEKVVLSKKGFSQVGFIHFAKRQAKVLLPVQLIEGIQKVQATYFAIWPKQLPPWSVVEQRIELELGTWPTKQLKELLDVGLFVIHVTISNVLFSASMIAVHVDEPKMVSIIRYGPMEDLDIAVKGMHNRTVQGLNSGPFKLQVEVARPLEKSKKRAREESSQTVSQPKVFKAESGFTSSSGHVLKVREEQDVADPYEVAVVSLPATVQDRLLRILRLGIATRYDVSI